MGQILINNNAASTLAASISSTATTLTVVSASSFPSPSPSAGTYFILTVSHVAAGTPSEIMYVTAVSGDTFTVVRGQESTTASAWNAGDSAVNGITAGTILTIQNGTYYTAPFSGAQLRSLNDRALDFPISAFDFMTAEEISSVRTGSGVDVTLAMQSALDAAESAGRILYCPSGQYLVGNLYYGNQNTTSESAAPYGLVGEGRTTTFLAKPGTIGTLIQAWSVAGCRFENFVINGNSSVSTGLDITWKPGAGPSLQSRYVFITISGCIGVSAILEQNNDVVVDQLIVNGSSESICAIDFVCTGGIAWLQNCIWNNGYLNFGAQNGTIENSWGMGIQFCGGGLNYVALAGLYLPGNSWRGATIWSESYVPQASVRALFMTGCQILSGVADSAIFDLNAYSIIESVGCQYLSPASGVAYMFGPNSRTDSYASVQVNFRGGSVDGSGIAFSKPSGLPAAAFGYIVNFDGFMNDSTGYNFPNKASSIYASGGLSDPLSSATWYDIIDSSIIQESGIYLVSISYDNHGAGQPYVFLAAALMPLITQGAGGAYGVGAVMNANLSSYFPDDDCTVQFRLMGVGGGTPKIQVKWTAGSYDGGGPLPPNSLDWTITKLA